MSANRRAGKHGLPVFLAHELLALKREGSTAVVVLDVAGKIRFGATFDPNRWVRNVADKANAEVRVVSIGWAPDGRLARRVKGAAERILEGRKIDGVRFDVPADLALGALDLAVERTGITLRSTREVLASSSVKDLKNGVSGHLYKSLMKNMGIRKRQEKLLAGIMR